MNRSIFQIWQKINNVNLVKSEYYKIYESKADYKLNSDLTYFCQEFYNLINIMIKKKHSIYFLDINLNNKYEYEIKRINKTTIDKLEEINNLVFIFSIFYIDNKNELNMKILYCLKNRKFFNNSVLKDSKLINNNIKLDSLIFNSIYIPEKETNSKYTINSNFIIYKYLLSNTEDFLIFYDTLNYCNLLKINYPDVYQKSNSNWLYIKFKLFFIKLHKNIKYQYLKLKFRGDNKIKNRDIIIYLIKSLISKFNKLKLINIVVGFFLILFYYYWVQTLNCMLPKKILYNTFSIEDVQFDFITSLKIEHIKEELEKIKNIEDYMNSVEPKLFVLNLENYPEILNEAQNKKSYYFHPILGISTTDKTSILMPTFSLSHSTKFLINPIEISKTDIYGKDRIQFLSNYVTFNTTIDLNAKVFTPEQNYNFFKSWIQIRKNECCKNILLIKEIFEKIRI